MRGWDDFDVCQHLSGNLGVPALALISLGTACRPGPPLVGMLTYSGLVTLYLGYLGIAGTFGGALLWPAVILHLALTVLLVKSC